jgi:membrane protein DedA with SNARE-associated domain
MGYSINMTIIGTFIWSIIFFLLGIYLEQIKPKEFGLYRHPFYLCKKST